MALPTPLPHFEPCRRMKMLKSRPLPPRPDRRRSIRGSFSWIDNRFLREGFDQGLTRLEKLFYFVLVAISNQDGVSFYSDARLAELLDIRFPHELDGARKELVARDLIAYDGGIYQVLCLPVGPPCKPRDASPPPRHLVFLSGFFYRPGGRMFWPHAASDLESVKQLLERLGLGPR